MAETSFVWPTTGSGDVSPTSVADSGALLAALINVSSLNSGASLLNQGVLANVLNQLKPTILGATITVDTGWAIVDGHPYRNSSLATFTPAAATGGGTTGRRLVLRATWASGTQTVRLTEISSAAANTAIPAMTQTPGVTFDIPICEYQVTSGGTTPSAMTDDRVLIGNGSFSQAVRNDFRLLRRPVAWWVASGSVATSSIGLQASQNGGLTNGNISGEPVGLANSTATPYRYLNATSGSGGLSPNHSPRMLVRSQLPAASANVTYWLLGFFDAEGATPGAGATLRIVTTGHVFFATIQGSVETTTDLGVLSRTTVLGFELESPDAGVTWTCKSQAQAGLAAPLASHTTNVPTAGTAINFGYASTIATAGVSHGNASIYVEASFT